MVSLKMKTFSNSKRHPALFMSYFSINVFPFHEKICSGLVFYFLLPSEVDS